MTSTTKKSGSGNFEEKRSTEGVAVKSQATVAAAPVAALGVGPVAALVAVLGVR